MAYFAKGNLRKATCGRNRRKKLAALAEEKTVFCCATGALRGTGTIVRKDSGIRPQRFSGNEYRVKYSAKTAPQCLRCRFRRGETVKIEAFDFDRTKRETRGGRFLPAPHRMRTAVRVRSDGKTQRTKKMRSGCNFFVSVHRHKTAGVEVDLCLFIPLALCFLVIFPQNVRRNSRFSRGGVV